MTNEKWTPVPIVPYNIKYLVSNMGRVKSKDRKVNYREKSIQKNIKKNLSRQSFKPSNQFRRIQICIVEN